MPNPLWLCPTLKGGASIEDGQVGGVDRPGPCRISEKMNQYKPGFDDLRKQQQMPAKKNTRNNKGKGKARKNHPKDLPLVSFVPSSKNIIMSFVSSTSMTESAANLGTGTFYRLNSVYDPLASGVGASAFGYNTWASLFLNYKVRKVTARVQGFASGLSTGAFANVVIAPVPFQSVIPANKDTWKQIRGARTYAITAGANGGKNSFSHVATYDNAWVAQVTKAQYVVDMDWSGQVGSNPTRQNYLLVAVDGVASTTPVSLAFNVQITYQVEWFNPVPIQ